MPNGLTLKIHEIKNYPQNKEKSNPTGQYINDWSEYLKIWSWVGTRSITI